MNTVLLLAEHGTARLPLEVVGERYLGIGKAESYRKAVAETLPFPALELGSSRSGWLVDIRDLAEWIDGHRTKGDAWRNNNKNGVTKSC